MIDFSFENEKGRVLLSDLMGIPPEPMVVWIFEHKMPDQVSVPRLLFNCAKQMQLEGNIRVTRLTTGEQTDVFVEEAPSVSRFGIPLVHPCSPRTYFCDYCYEAYYQTKSFCITKPMMNTLMTMFDVFTGFHALIKIKK
jgi:hypothetical protein